jgi:hypothetical protein
MKQASNQLFSERLHSVCSATLPNLSAATATVDPHLPGSTPFFPPRCRPGAPSPAAEHREDARPMPRRPAPPTAPTLVPCGSSRAAPLELRLEHFLKRRIAVFRKKMLRMLNGIRSGSDRARAARRLKCFRVDDRSMKLGGEHDQCKSRSYGRRR